MSAICGVVGVDGRPWSSRDLAPVAAFLEPFGPDGGGAWDGTCGRCGVALAASLRHATPEDAGEAQPASTGDGSLVLVGDLRVDNRAELTATLGLPNETTLPDSAIVLAGYERWGAGVLDHLVGDFALAIVDRGKGGVLLARDHIGTRPLVLHRRPGVVAFASNALALTRLEGVGHRLDTHHAAEALALIYSSDRTFVEGVEWVPPATAVWVDSSGLRRREWWAPDPHATVNLSSAEAYERELRDAFDAAVAARLRSAGGVGASSSGGLDSSSAAATAAGMLAPARLPTFTSAPPAGWSAGERPGWDADESGLVRELAALHPNMDPHVVRLAPGMSVLDSREPLWELGAGPARNPCNLLWMRAVRERAAEAGVGTLIVGDRGNHFFSADGPEWLVRLLGAGRLRAFARESAAWRRVTGAGWYGTLRGELMPHLAPASLHRLRRRLKREGHPADDWIATTSLRPELARTLAMSSLLPQLDDRRRPDLRVLALQIFRHFAGLADVEHALTARTGVEPRDPTGEGRVFEAAMRQPEWIRRHDGITRAVVRGAMADRLPPAIVRRTRRGEQLPDWLDLMTAARPELDSALRALEEHALSLELIDAARLRRLFDHWPDPARRADPQVVADYRYALLRGLEVSAYLRWFERQAAEAPSP
jgi:asparagine synthase (glutamine-hydrolysing)